MVAAAAGASVVMLVAWFPAGALYHQHQQLDAAAGQLAQVRRQDRALSAEKQRLANPAEVARIARSQFELVGPGQQPYEILPPNGTAGSASYAGDPGNQAPVDPSVAQELPPGALASTTAGSAGTAPESRGPSTRATAHSSSAGAPGIWSRIVADARVLALSDRTVRVAGR